MSRKPRRERTRTKEAAKKEAVIFQAVERTNVCGVPLVVYSDGGGTRFFRRCEVVDELGRVFTKNPEQWEKYSRYGVARIPDRFIDKRRVERFGDHWNPRLETGKVEAFLTSDGIFRAFAASRSYFGTKARNRFLKAQEEGDLKRLTKAAFKLLAEREAEIKRLVEQGRNADGADA